MVSMKTRRLTERLRSLLRSRLCVGPKRFGAARGHDIEPRKRKYEPSSVADELLFSLQYCGLEVPWKYEKIFRLHFPRLCFRYDRNSRTGCISPELIRINFGDTGKQTR